MITPDIGATLNVVYEIITADLSTMSALGTAMEDKLSPDNQHGLTKIIKKTAYIGAKCLQTIPFAFFANVLMGKYINLDSIFFHSVLALTITPLIPGILSKLNFKNEEIKHFCEKADTYIMSTVKVLNLAMSIFISSLPFYYGVYPVIYIASMLTTTAIQAYFTSKHFLKMVSEESDQLLKRPLQV
jgi:hypothetical protein